MEPRLSIQPYIMALTVSGGGGDCGYRFAAGLAVAGVETVAGLVEEDW